MFPIRVFFWLEHLGCVWEALGGHDEQLSSTFLFWMVQQVSGKIQEGPTSPPDPLKTYLGFIKTLCMVKCSVMFAYLSIRLLLQASDDFCLYILLVTVTGLRCLSPIQFPALSFQQSLCKWTKSTPWSTATVIMTVSHCC